jgi:hypothetical protein
MKNLITTFTLFLFSITSIFAQTEWIAHRSHSGKDFAFKIRSIYGLGLPDHDAMLHFKPVKVETLVVPKTTVKNGVVKPKEVEKDSLIEKIPVKEKQPEVIIQPKVVVPPAKPKSKHTVPPVPAKKSDTIAKKEVVVTPLNVEPRPTIERITVTQPKSKQSSSLGWLVLLLSAPILLGFSLYIRKLG